MSTQSHKEGSIATQSILTQSKEEGCFFRLPPELRNSVYDYLVPCHPAEYKWSRYAIVCGEWRRRFEPENFAHLVLDQDRLDSFRCLVAENDYRRPAVRSITLYFRLPIYDCKTCHTPEEIFDVFLYEAALRKTLCTFFRIIAPWSRDENRNKGIELEIGCYSPSDGTHGLRDLRLAGRPLPTMGGAERLDEVREYNWMLARQVDSSDYGCQEWALTLESRWAQYHNLVDQDHEREAVRAMTPIGGVHFLRSWSTEERKYRGDNLYASTSLYRPEGETMQADVVKEVFIRRFHYRVILPSIVGVVMAKCPRLERLYHWKWRPDDFPNSPIYPPGMFGSSLEFLTTRLWQGKLGRDLKELHLFEEARTPLDLDTSETFNSDKLGEELSKAALGLEAFSACFVVEARDFFQSAAKLQATYSNLKYLQLTSRDLSINGATLGNLQQRDDFLRLACTVAWKQMPKLELLEIWHAAEGHGTMFNFTNKMGSERHSRITLHAAGRAATNRIFDELRDEFKSVRPGERLDCYSFVWGLDDRVIRAGDVLIMWSRMPTWFGDTRSRQNVAFERHAAMEMESDDVKEEIRNLSVDVLGRIDEPHGVVVQETGYMLPNPWAVPGEWRSLYPR